MGILYRTRQFWAALSAAPAGKDLDLAAQTLSREQFALFRRMQPSEQAHSLEVLQGLLRQEPIERELAAAALLHDVGKIRFPLRTWERVLIVIAQSALPRQAKAWGAAEPDGWKRPFVVAEKHPDWGADLAEQAGLGTRGVEVIRRHQRKLFPTAAEDPLYPFLVRLQSLDNER